ncbi:MAG: ABC transporter permease [Clostridiales Family XIII bacterium]|jgi:ribose transport system permease protein|nr:ABC transporter permease [Clostridiales Family XIII bacterium]
MAKTRGKTDISTTTSVILLIAVFLFFLATTGGKELNAISLQNILDASVIYIIAGLGLLFVAAQGSADLSIGVNLGLSTVIATAIALKVHGDWVAIPLTIVFAACLGLLNGWLIGTMKVPSFMVTIAWLLGLRGFIVYFQTDIMPKFLPDMTAAYYQTAGPLLALKNNAVKYPIFIALIVVFYLLLQHTKFGSYCRAIGENELVAKNIGVPVRKIKLLAFMVSGLMAGIAGLFYLTRNGGTNNTVGQNLEVEVLVCIFAGCILVTGGYGTNVPKLLIGCFTFSILSNGIGLMSATLTKTFPLIPPAFWKSVPRGIMLILIMYAVIRMREWEGKRSVKLTEEDEARTLNAALDAASAK